MKVLRLREIMSDAAPVQWSSHHQPWFVCETTGSCVSGLHVDEGPNDDPNGTSIGESKTWSGSRAREFVPHFLFMLVTLRRRPNPC